MQSPPPIPDELMTEIFSCLRLKPLMRFKLVCKPWNSLISDNLTHLRRRSANIPRVLFVSCIAPFSLSSLPIKSLLETPAEPELICTLERRHIILGSCNGLVCLLGTRFCSLSNRLHSWVLLLNPTTGSKSRKSPEVVTTNMNLYVDSYGFGYDHVSDTYKAVVLPDYRRRINLHRNVKVLSIGDTNWRDVRFSAPAKIDYKFGVHLNGTLNWLVFRINHNNNNQEIFSFDLNKERPVTFSLPDTSLNRPRLGILGGCLCVSHATNLVQNFIIWQMKEFGVHQSWTQLLNIRWEGFWIPPTLDFPLYIFDNGDVVMLKDKLLYDHRDNRLHFLPNIESIVNRDSAIIYFE